MEYRVIRHIRDRFDVRVLAGDNLLPMDFKVMYTTGDFSEAESCMKVLKANPGINLFFAESDGRP
jgi:hypothetical protein